MGELHQTDNGEPENKADGYAALSNVNLSMSTLMVISILSGIFRLQPIFVIQAALNTENINGKFTLQQLNSFSQLANRDHKNRTGIYRKHIATDIDQDVKDLVGNAVDAAEKTVKS